MTTATIGAREAPLDRRDSTAAVAGTACGAMPISVSMGRPSATTLGLDDTIAAAIDPFLKGRRPVG